MLTATLPSPVTHFIAHPLHRNFTRDHSVQDSLEYALTWNQSAIQMEDMAIAGAAKMMKQNAEYKDVPAVKSKL